MEVQKHSYLRVNGGGGEINIEMCEKPNIFQYILISLQIIWRGGNIRDVNKTQHFQFYPDIHVKHLGGGTIFLGFSFYPDIRAKYLGGGNIFLGNVYNPMFFILS